MLFIIMKVHHHQEKYTDTWDNHHEQSTIAQYKKSEIHEHILLVCVKIKMHSTTLRKNLNYVQM